MVTGSRNRESIAAEAAAWIVRIHADDVDVATKAGLQAWLDVDVEHQAAFAAAQRVWRMLPRAATPSGEDKLPARPKPRRAIAMAAAASLLASIGLGVIFFERMSDRSYETLPGQQQSILFEDGSRIILNTSSAVTVSYDRSERRVRLDHGEAMFEVARDPERPFIVSNQNREVRALGTTFLVKEDGQRAFVTLIEGRVEVSRDASDHRHRLAILKPGERLSILGNVGARIDRPSLDVETAWRNGRVIFEGTPLLEAANEMNRYAVGMQLAVAPEAASHQISGTFTIGSTLDFANSVAAIHDLRIDRKGGQVRILPMESSRLPLALKK